MPFRIYKNDEVIDEGESPLTITGIEPDTEVDDGEYDVVRVDEDMESERVPIPSFRTLPIAVTGVSVSPRNSTTEEGESGNRELDIAIEPSNATNQNYTISSDLDVDGDTISWDEELEAGEYVTTITTDDGGHTTTHTLTVEGEED